MENNLRVHAMTRWMEERRRQEEVEYFNCMWYLHHGSQYTASVPLTYPAAANAFAAPAVNTHLPIPSNPPPVTHQPRQTFLPSFQRPFHHFTRSMLRPQAPPFVPLSEQSLPRNTPSNTSTTSISQLQMAPTTPQAHDTAATPSAQPAVASSSRPNLQSTPFQLTLPQVPYSNVWNPMPNASFNPSSSLWSNTELVNRQTIVATAPETPQRVSIAANTPKNAIPTPIIVTPPRTSPRRSGPGSPNWRARTRGPNRSPSPLAQPSETSNMPVPMLFHNSSPSPRRSATPRPETSASPKPSVKHLTCWWWHEKGQCRFSDEECLYAHRETGNIADAPRQVRPGEPALAGRSLDRALRRIASESGSLKSRSRSPLRSHTPSEADIPHSAVELQNKNLRAENVDLRNEIELLRTGIKVLYVSHAAMVNNASQFRRYVDGTWRELTIMVANGVNANAAQSYSYPGIIGSGPTRQMNQYRQQTQRQFLQIREVLRDLEPRTLTCASSEWAARANMTKVVKDIEVGTSGWDLAAAVAQEAYAEEMAAAASAQQTAATAPAPVGGVANLGNNLANMTL